MGKQTSLVLLLLVQLMVLSPGPAVLLLQLYFLPSSLLERQNLPLSQVSGRKMSFLFQFWSLFFSKLFFNLAAI